MTARPAHSMEPKIEHQRPWGSYRILETKPGHQVKRLTVNPCHQLSLQRHHRRSEHWYVVSGEGRVTLSDNVGDHYDPRHYRVMNGGMFQSIDIPRGKWHRLGAVGDEPLVIIEIQTGDYFGEDDIERVEDDYGRAG